MYLVELKKNVKGTKKKEPEFKIHNTTPKAETNTQSAKSMHRTDKLSRCSKQERKLISKIFSIIIKNTDEVIAENIIQKIEEEFK